MSPVAPIGRNSLSFLGAATTSRVTRNDRNDEAFREPLTVAAGGWQRLQ
ncbi:hypothetical protein BH24CHL3_BH24CHL3_07650 [soil metagenome]